MMIRKREVEKDVCAIKPHIRYNIGCHLMSYYIILYHTILYCIISYHIIPYIKLRSKNNF